MNLNNCLKRAGLTVVGGFITLAAANLQAAPINLLTNGSFETITRPTFSNAGFTRVTNGELTGWTTIGTDQPWYMTNATGQFGLAQNGTAFLNYTNAPLGPISQAFAVTAGTAYTVSFWQAQRVDVVGANGGMTATIALLAGSASGATTLAATNTAAISNANAATGWQQYAFTFTPSNTTTATLSIAGSGDGYAVLDNVTVTTVPEPASLALLAIGGIALLRRRRA